MNIALCLISKETCVSLYKGQLTALSNESIQSGSPNPERGSDGNKVAVGVSVGIGLGAGVPPSGRGVLVGSGVSPGGSVLSAGVVAVAVGRSGAAPASVGGADLVNSAMTV